MPPLSRTERCSVAPHAASDPEDGKAQDSSHNRENHAPHDEKLRCADDWGASRGRTPVGLEVDDAPDVGPYDIPSPERTTVGRIRFWAGESYFSTLSQKNVALRRSQEDNQAAPGHVDQD